MHGQQQEGSERLICLRAVGMLNTRGRLDITSCSCSSNSAVTCRPLYFKAVLRPRALRPADMAAPACLPLCAHADVRAHPAGDGAGAWHLHCVPLCGGQRQAGARQPPPAACRLPPASCTRGSAAASCVQGVRCCAPGVCACTMHLLPPLSAGNPAFSFKRAPAPSTPAARPCCPPLPSPPGPPAPDPPGVRAAGGGQGGH